MTLFEWFDPYNIDHIKAYRCLEDTGAWPKGFIPEDVTISMDGLWNIELTGKMAQAWLQHMENERCPPE